MGNPDGFVRKISSTGEAYYKLHILGVNLNDGRAFSWRVPSLAGGKLSCGGNRYDFTAAEIAPALVAEINAFNATNSAEVL